MKRPNPTLVALILTALCGAALAPQARADAVVGWGPRMGISSDPDQVYFGAHFDLGRLSQHLRFQPNVELGVGDDRTLLATNFEVDYRFGSHLDRWSPYVGGGLGIVTVGADDGLFDGPNHSDLAAAGVFGLETIQGANRFFMEAKVGLVDAPDLKLGIGWTFY